MPKLLPNLQESFLAHAKQILREEGYAALSIRRLAGECQVATGTVYNYFRNKEELVARIMMADWRVALERMEAAAREAQTLAEGMSGLYGAIAAFVAHYEPVWSQYVQGGGSGGVVASHHLQLRGQITVPLQALLGRTASADWLPLAPLLAETLLAAAVQPDLDEALVLRMAQQISPKEKENE